METATATASCSAMTKLQKLAALLIIVGPDNAAELLKTLDEPELEAVTMEMAGLPFISQEMQQEILMEFTEVVLQAGTAVLGGAGYAKNALERSLGASRASDIIGRLAPKPAASAAMQQLLAMDACQLFNLLNHEHPQTVALIVSHLSPEKSCRLLELQPPPVRDQVIERLATLGPTPAEVVERIAKVLIQKTGGKPARALSRTGGLKTAADLLNSLDKNLSQSVLRDLEKRNPQLGQEIRQKMLTFEDLALLDPPALQKIMREVDMRDLAIALKPAPPKLKKTLLSALSQRAAETVNEEISFLGPLRQRVVDASQARITAIVRQLESNGEIELSNLSRSSRNELLV